MAYFTASTRTFIGFPTAFQPLSINPGPDGIFGTDDDLISPGPDNVYGTSDDTIDSTWAVAGTAGQTPGIAQAFTLFNTRTPEIFADIDRTKAEMLGVPISRALSQ